MIVGFSGCAAFDPGGQVRRSLTQSKIYEWREDGSFWVEGNGTQTERFIMAQGDVKIITNDEGDEVIDWENSHIAYYLEADPSADAASAAMAQALQASTQQVQYLSQTFDNMIDLLGTLMGARLGPQVSGDGTQPGLGDEVRSLIEAEVRRLLENPPTAPHPG
jgi:hypothetical protein